MICTNPLCDTQEKAPTGYCARCGADLYSYDTGAICTECQEEIKAPETVVEYAEAWPRKWFKFIWDIINEDYMKPVLQQFKEYCEGGDADGPDFESWAES